MLSFATVALLVTVLAALFVGYLWARYADRARTTAGELLAEPIPQYVPTLQRNGWLNLLMAFGVLCEGAAFATRFGASTTTTAVCLASFLLAIPWFVWVWRRVRPMNVEFRRNGIVFGGDNFEPWNALISRTWLDRGRNPRLAVLKCQFDRRVVDLSFRADRRDQVESIVAKCAGKIAA